MASTQSLSSHTLKLDPAAAAGLITRGADAGGRAAAVGASEGSGVAGGVSPIDAGVAALRAEGFALKTGWIAAVSAKSTLRQTGESGGVESMLQQESENAARLGEVGPQGAGSTTATVAI
jgi:hypothetical protein